MSFFDDIPFLTYREESRKFYFLNSAVSTDEPQGEYIDYGGGDVPVPRGKAGLGASPKALKGSASEELPAL